MFRFLAPLAFVALLVTACIDLSGEGSEPNTSGSLDTTEAGRAALLTGPLNPETCEEVLADPPSSYTLQLQALTASAQGGSPRLETMCAAIFQTSAADGSFLTMALIRFDSLDPAIARYNLLKAALIALESSDLRNRQCQRRFAGLVRGPHRQRWHRPNYRAAPQQLGP